MTRLGPFRLTVLAFSFVYVPVVRILSVTSFQHLDLSGFVVSHICHIQVRKNGPIEDVLWGSLDLRVSFMTLMHNLFLHSHCYLRLREGKATSPPPPPEAGYKYPTVMGPMSPAIGKTKPSLVITAKDDEQEGYCWAFEVLGGTFTCLR